MRIVISLPEDSNEFQSLQASDARATAARLGLEVQLETADGSAVQQIQQVFKHIHSSEGPAGLIIEPVSTEGMASVAKKAARAGIGVALLNSTADFVEPLRREFPAVPVFTVASDQEEIGQIQGRQCRALLPSGRGNVLYLHGPHGATAALERFKGFQHATQGSGIRLIVLDGQWTESSAEQAVQKWLRLKISEGLQIDVVAAQDDSMARGAHRAIKAYTVGLAPEVRQGWSRVPFLGIDGVPDVGQKLVDQGELTATVVMPSNTGPALEQFLRWSHTGVQPPALVRVPVRPYPDLGALERLGRRKLA